MVKECCRGTTGQVVLGQAWHHPWIRVVVIRLCLVIQILSLILEMSHVSIGDLNHLSMVRLIFIPVAQIRMLTLLANVLVSTLPVCPARTIWDLSRVVCHHRQTNMALLDPGCLPLALWIRAHYRFLGLVPHFRMIVLLDQVVYHHDVRMVKIICAWLVSLYDNMLVVFDRLVHTFCSSCLVRCVFYNSLPFEHQLCYKLVMCVCSLFPLKCVVLLSRKMCGRWLLLGRWWWSCMDFFVVFLWLVNVSCIRCIVVWLYCTTPLVQNGVIVVHSELCVSVLWTLVDLPLDCVMWPFLCPCGRGSDVSLCDQFTVSLSFLPVSCGRFVTTI